jgi:hypothetical protein
VTDKLYKQVCAFSVIKTMKPGEVLIDYGCNQWCGGRTAIEMYMNAMNNVLMYPGEVFDNSLTYNVPGGTAHSTHKYALRYRLKNFTADFVCNELEGDTPLLCPLDVAQNVMHISTLVIPNGTDEPDCFWFSLALNIGMTPMDKFFGLWKINLLAPVNAFPDLILAPDATKITAPVATQPPALEKLDRILRGLSDAEFNSKLVDDSRTPHSYASQSKDYWLLDANAKHRMHNTPRKNLFTLLTSNGDASNGLDCSPNDFCDMFHTQVIPQPNTDGTCDAPYELWHHRGDKSVEHLVLPHKWIGSTTFYMRDGLYREFADNRCITQECESFHAFEDTIAMLGSKDPSGTEIETDFTTLEIAENAGEQDVTMGMLF